MKTVTIILSLCLYAASWQLNRVAKERDESYAMIQESLDLITKWQRVAKTNEQSAEYWFRAHMETISFYESNNPKNEQ